MKINKTRILFLVGAVITIGVILIGFPVVRQNALNAQMLQAITAGASPTAISDLLRRGADPNAGQTQFYDSALDRALFRSNPDTVRLLLDAGASVVPQGQAHISPTLYLACYQGPRAYLPTRTGYRTLFTELRNHGASLEERDSLGFTPLMRAVWSGNVDGTEALLALGANPRARNNRGDRVLDMEVQDGDVVGQIRIDNLLRPYKQAYPGVQPTR